eukprot:2236820-Rhodomonas_salina.1
MHCHSRYPASQPLTSVQPLRSADAATSRQPRPGRIATRLCAQQHCYCAETEQPLACRQAYSH